ncbi:AGR013Cp [Eremothecium gossypii ATCC 10895]|uniref:AGR013Cp n=1 Tax=Eremothecium gossypii (strain ATCC 10895 / CBS 109.51 / FGSC 9923 / NRRL Y-1056) TaxID=284811 RepID=Q750E2_EREGS|nr:AGR013Cp [Eremothecium gossypii ATCC 10895]AAS54502.2 AGR013Cp [Eremothecium gossypii ATCC 10895]AEY98834.1 FAGR013Cp [Eremothecium gossypii FDAG1]
MAVGEHTFVSQRAEPRYHGNPKPMPAYYPTSKDSALVPDFGFYDSIRGAPRRVVKTYEVPVRAGQAWKAPRGSVVRVSTPYGPQVLDFNCWEANSSFKEHLWAARTRQLQSSHVSTYDRLWSNLPYLRPLLTIIDDSLADYGPDEHGGRVHDLLGTRCDPYVDKLLSGEDNDFHCHSNLYRAIRPFGGGEHHVHDVLNLFQVTGLNEHGQYFMEASPAKPGDYIEFFAEVDLLCAISTCPGGDLSMWGWGEGAVGANEKNVTDMSSVCRPVRVEVFELDDPETVLRGWSSPQPVRYGGNHGIEN